MTDREMDEVIRLMESGESYETAHAGVKSGDALALLDELHARAASSE